MNKLSVAILLLGGFIFTSGIVCAEEDAAILAQGKAAYEMQCARCHGLTGEGDGVDAKRLPVNPRVLTSGRFKFRTTASGTPPTDADLMHVLDHGLSGSGMPSFSSLQKETKEHIIAYIKTFSPVFKDYKPQPVAAPNEKVRVDLNKGKELFAKLQCALCHGAQGRANGPSAATLVDSWGQPIRAANLTEGWTYRAGSSPKEIYYRLMAGLDGAPMPSYDGAVNKDEAWQLANYVASMQVKTNWSFEIHPQKISGELPSTWKAPEWDTAPHTDVNMQSALYKGGKREITTIVAVSVRMLYNEKATAAVLMWSDPTMSDKSPADALLVAFKPRDYKGAPRTNLHNGYESDSAELNLTYWQASDPFVARQKISSIENALRSGWSGGTSLTAKGEYHDGAWHLMIVWPKADIDAAAIGFAGWDGSNKETDLKRSVSQWITLSHGEPAHH